MGHGESHISDENLLRAADRELPAREIAEIQAHLAACWTCRTRMGELERTIADFVHLHQDLGPALPPEDGARALLKLRMAELAAESPSNPRRRFVANLFERRGVALVCCGFVLLGVGILLLRNVHTSGEARAYARLEARAIPDPNITPGATLPVTRNDICAADMAETVRLVPARVAEQVFAAYGIHHPRPRAYELDYLITPALGGSDNIRNFWPQPYEAIVWNAHVKDALEDHLHRMVCAGKVDLAIAQSDISRDWTAAYRKYFRTDKPLPEHAAFLKDRPWE